MADERIRYLLTAQFLHLLLQLLFTSEKFTGHALKETRQLP